MRSYTLNLSEGAVHGDARALERAHVVPDGFSWPAFAFSVLWFLRHRLWLAALLVLVGLLALALLGWFLELSVGAGTAVAVLASLLIGFEASSLRRWTCARRGLPARDAVVAGSAEEAEAKLLARWLAPAHAPASPKAVPPMPRRTRDEVIGLFPLGEARP